MEPYSSIQDQLANINHTLNNGLNKIYEELDQLSQRVRQLEHSSSQDDLNLIREKMNKIHDTQIGALETLLVGHHYQFKRLSNVIVKGQDSNYDDNKGLDDDADEYADESDDEVRLQKMNSVIANSTDSNSNNSISLNKQKIDHKNNTPSPSRTGINVNNRVNITPSNLSLAPSNPIQTTQRPASNLSALRTYTSIPTIDNEISMDSNSIDDVNSNSLDRNLWTNAPFHRLNPILNSVQDVIDEFYYGFEGQPPLRYLETHRKTWRSKDKNLSKTFCRRQRVATAVDAGTTLYMREYGLSENSARERTINELENLRIKSDGKKETMYWLFHNIPNHLKKKQYNHSLGSV